MVSFTGTPFFTVMVDGVNSNCFAVIVNSFTLPEDCATVVAVTPFTVVVVASVTELLVAAQPLTRTVTSSSAARMFFMDYSSKTKI